MRNSFVFASAPIWLKAEEGEGASKLRKFSMVAYTGKEMVVGGWPHPVVVDLAGLSGTTRTRPILKDHDVGQIVGHTSTIVKDGMTLRVDGIVSGTGAAAAEVLGSSLNGFPWQASIGARVSKVVFLERDKTANVNGQEVTGPLYLVRKAVLGEVSFVALGADDDTSATVAAASAPLGSKEVLPMDFEKWVEAKGFKLADLSEVQIASLKAAYEMEKAEVVPTPTPATPPVVDAVAAMRLAASAEEDRMTKVRTIAKDYPAISIKALGEGWTVEHTELEVLRASRPAPSIIIPSTERSGPEVLEAAVCMAGRLGNVEKTFKPETLDAAHKQYRRGISLHEVLLAAATMGGYLGRQTVNAGNLREVLTAAFSTVSLPGILSNTANKFLLESFMAVEQVWRQICSIRPVNDFKTVTSYRLTGDLTYREVAPSGEIQHGTLSEESYTNKADTYGRMMAINRQTLINDDLGALLQIPRMLGRGAGLKLNDVFWAEFMNNAAFFNAGNSNYISGALTVLNVTQLGAVEKKFLDMVDPDGKPINVFPALLLVPTALKVTAEEIYKSTEVRDTTASTKAGTTNVYAGRFTPVCSAYLANAAFTGYSATAWYLLADPRSMAAIEVAFLNGNESPIIETADVDFNTLGIQMRGYHDFGVNKQEYRAGVKSKGAA